MNSANAKYASIVINANSGKVLHQTNADTRNYPASLTKMMSLYILFDAIKDNTLDLNTKLKVSRRAVRQPASRLGLRYGQSISVHDAILAIVTKSANDVATVISEKISGTERSFALKMTSKARILGMNRTTFRNASGLPHRGQLSTARDMARLALALIRDHPNFYNYFSTKGFKFKGRHHKNHNKLLTTYQGVDGIKTGYIRASGYNLVASVKRGNQRLIGVVFGGNSSKHRNRHMTRLLNRAFKKLNNVIARQDSKEQGNKKSITLSKQVMWGIQVGAFMKYSQAFKAAKIAIKTANRLLITGEINVVSLKKRSGRILYKARINGITKRQAYKACRYLKKKNQHCMERLIRRRTEVASINF